VIRELEDAGFVMGVWWGRLGSRSFLAWKLVWNCFTNVMEPIVDSESSRTKSVSLKSVVLCAVV